MVLNPHPLNKVATPQHSNQSRFKALKPTKQLQLDAVFDDEVVEESSNSSRDRMDTLSRISESADTQFTYPQMKKQLVSPHAITGRHPMSTKNEEY